MATVKTCPHDATQHVHLSGTKSEKITQWRSITNHFRPEVAEVLIKGLQTTLRWEVT